jgi:acyl carrier protein
MTNRDDLERRLREIFASVLKLDANRIRPDSHLRDDLHITSLQLLDLAFEIEDALGVVIENNAVLRMHRFSDVVREIEATGDTVKRAR